MSGLSLSSRGCRGREGRSGQPSAGSRWGFRLSVAAMLGVLAVAPPLLSPARVVAQQTSCPGSDTLDFLIEGFGQDTVGGFQPGHDVYCVTSGLDDGPGTLREAMRTGGEPRLVRFVQDTVIDLQSAILLPSNITVDGRGYNVVIKGKGVVVHGQHDVILTNIAFEDTYPTSSDGIQIGTIDLPAQRVVLDHVRFSQTTGEGSSDYVDEAISVIFGSSEVTVQWCRFDEWEKVLLAGNGDAEPAVDRNITLTLHHNFFNQTGRRHPRGRYGQFDVYNNYFYDWHMFVRAGPQGWHLSHGAKCDEGCRMRLESNVFERYWHPQDLFSDANKASMCEKGGQVTELNEWVHPDTDVDLRFGVYCREGDWQRPYEATLDEAGPALIELLMAETGNIYQGSRAAAP